MAVKSNQWFEKSAKTLKNFLLNIWRITRNAFEHSWTDVETGAAGFHLAVKYNTSELNSIEFEFISFHWKEVEQVMNIWDQYRL